MIITKWKGVTNPANESVEVTWPQLVAMLQEAKRLGPGWGGVRFKPGTGRKLENVEAVTVAVFDVDHGNVSEATIRRALNGWSAVFHVTKRHKVTDARWRVVIAIDREMTVAEYRRFWQSMRAHFASHGIELDESPKDSSRFWFLPSNPGSKAAFVSFSLDGYPIFVDAELAKVPELIPVAPAERARVTAEPIARGWDGEETSDVVRIAAYLYRVLERSVERISALQEGDRNNAMFAISATAFEWFLSCDALPDVVTEELIEAGLACGLRKREVNKVLDNALAAAQKKGKCKTVPDRPKSAATPVAPLAAYPKDWDAGHVTIDHLDEEERIIASSDVHHAESFVHMFGKDIRYVTTWKKWIVWNGKFWSLDETNAVIQLAVTATKRIAARELADGKETKDIGNLQTYGKIRSILSIASSSRALAVHHDDLDRHHNYFNCANGTLNLLTGELQEFQRDDMMTKTSRVEYLAGSTCDAWRTFLGQAMLGRQELVHFLKCYAGYSLSSYVNDQSIVFLNGDGNNGKSTFMLLLAEIMGDYVAYLPRDVLNLRNKGGDAHPTGLTSLVGARMAIAPEVQEDDRLNEALIKDLTGGETITARKMKQDFWSFKPTHKIWFPGNHRPQIRGTDVGIWRRMRLVPWDLNLSEEQKDRSLVDKLRAELPGILMWAYEGFREWYAKGMPFPQAMVASVDVYRKESNSLTLFLRDCCELSGKHSTSKIEFRNEYSEFCKRMGMAQANETRVGAEMGRRGIGNGKRQESGISTRVWQGLRIVRDVERIEIETHENPGNPGNLVRH